MIEQRSGLEQLSEKPVTETSRWIVGEPSLQDVLDDPVVHAVLRRDGLSPQDLMRAINRGRSRLAPSRSSSNPAGSNTPLPISPGPVTPGLTPAPTLRTDAA